MAFVLHMAVREMRASWRRLLFFFLCLSLGVGSIVTLRSVVQTVRESLTRESRAMLGADVTIGANRAWDAKTRDQIEQVLHRYRVTGRLEEVETLSMIRPADPGHAVARLVEVCGVQQGYPMYGALELEGGRPYSFGLLRGRGALARPELLAQLGVGVGDTVMIGKLAFTIRGVLETEPGRRAGAFSFGSRVLVSLDDLSETGLLVFGSRADYRTLLKVSDDQVRPLSAALSEQLKGQFVSVRNYRSTEDHVGEELARTENYLSLIGLVIVILGGVGVWSVIRVFVNQKIKSVAVLKCLGATGRQILAVYLLQVLVMAIVGSAIGLLLGKITIASLQPILSRATGVRAAYGLTWPAIAQSTGIGLLVALLFAAVPLLDLRHMRPSLLLRASDAARPARDLVRLGTIVAVGACLVALASWQAASWQIGLILSAGLAVIALVLHGAGLLVIRAVSPLQHARAFSIRQAARRVSRPGNQTRAILLAVGLGTFFIVGVRSLQTSLVADMELQMKSDVPDMFLIEVQPDQAGPLKVFLAQHLHQPESQAVFIPVLRARVTGVKGRQLNLESAEEVRRRRSLGREYVITYRPRLERNERVIEGTFWPASPSGDAEVSIEQSLRDRVGLSVGDMVRFDILGRSVTARVTSVRSVDWTETRAGGFMFVFRPGVLDQAPQMFVVTTRGPSDPSARARLQRDVTERFPNVSVIDVREILVSVRRVLSSVTLAISVVGGLVLASGILILVGSISMTKYQRVYEAAVLKTLGATSRMVGLLLALEYALLGAVAGFIGSAGALGLSWAVSRYGVKMAWLPSPLEHVLAVIAAAFLVAGVGTVANLDVLRKKPLGTLRAE